MNERTGANKGTLEELRQNLEREKILARGELLRKTLEFAEFDSRFNSKMLELLDILVQAAKNNPDIVTRSDKGNIGEIVDALTKKQEEGSPGVTGGDIVGADWIDDLGRIINVMTGLVRDEKEFFLKIIDIIF